MGKDVIGSVCETSFGGRWNELKYTTAGTVTTDVVEKEICEEVRAESCYSQCF
jgi:hypothetical protein